TSRPGAGLPSSVVSRTTGTDPILLPTTPATLVSERASMRRTTTGPTGFSGNSGPPGSTATQPTSSIPTAHVFVSVQHAGQRLLRISPPGQSCVWTACATDLRIVGHSGNVGPRRPIPITPNPTPPGPRMDLTRTERVAALFDEALGMP